ncbi:MAG: protein kinase, partial [Coleofasciculaceae cyanobacterium SM2_3_26]|nr:protein kinase [Coleofasciculaceae cyanobacterium SM2_3_26]
RDSTNWENIPQIPTLYASFTFQNSLYLVQQFIEGMNLFEEYEARGRFSEAEILKLLQDLLPVLQLVHDAKILHRDIKPDNIMRRKSDGKLVLIDFGGVKQANTTMQGATGTVLYTSGYVALEQMLGKPNRTSDLYSLAATCVRLLTGCFPETDAYGDLHDELYDTSQFFLAMARSVATTGQECERSIGAGARSHVADGS